MYAVIATGGKQYRVEAGTVLRIELLTADAGTEVKFGDVLLVGSGDSVTVGSPKVAGASVTATVQRVDPGATLKIDLPAHQVSIESAQPREAFVQALADEGYPAA